MLFLEKLGDVDGGEVPCTAWTTRMPKYVQPDLNFTGNFKTKGYYTTCQILTKFSRFLIIFTAQVSNEKLCKNTKKNIQKTPSV